MKMQAKIADLNKKLDESKLKLHQQEDALMAKQAEIESKEKELMAREKSFEDLKAQRAGEQKTQQKDVGDISAKVAMLKAEKSMLEGQISKAQQDFEEVKNLTRARGSEISGFTARERELQVKEKTVADVGMTKEILAKKEKNLRKIDVLLIKKQRMLEQKEKELTKRRDAVEYELQKAEANRRVLYEEINTRQKELNDLTKLRDLRQRELDESEKLLKEKEIELL